MIEIMTAADLIELVIEKNIRSFLILIAVNFRTRQASERPQAAVRSVKKEMSSREPGSKFLLKNTICFLPGKKLREETLKCLFLIICEKQVQLTARFAAAWQAGKNRRD